MRVDKRTRTVTADCSLLSGSLVAYGTSSPGDRASGILSSSDTSYNQNASPLEKEIEVGHGSAQTRACRTGAGAAEEPLAELSSPLPSETLTRVPLLIHPLERNGSDTLNKKSTAVAGGKCLSKGKSGVGAGGLYNDVANTPMPTKLSSSGESELDDVFLDTSTDSRLSSGGSSDLSRLNHLPRYPQAKGPQHASSAKAAMSKSFSSNSSVHPSLGGANYAYFAIIIYSSGPLVKAIPSSSSRQPIPGKFSLDPGSGKRQGYHSSLNYLDMRHPSLLGGRPPVSVGELQEPNVQAPIRNPFGVSKRKGKGLGTK